MDLTMSCSSLSLLFFLISLQIYFLAPAASAFPLFQECTPSNCGGQEISYPFRHDKQPRYCGHPDYELDCNGDSLTLSMESLKYRVIHMNTSTQILVVARLDLSKEICLETYNETTLDLNLFNYTSNDLNSTLFFDCYSWPNPPWPTFPPYPFSCPESQDGYFFLGVDLPKPLLDPCSSIVHVPISKSETLGFPPPWMDGNESATISEILNKGFEITWILNTSLQCESCNKSGGRCGYGWTGEKFNCFCPDGAYLTTCPGSPIPANVPSTPPAPRIIPSGMYADSHPICGFQIAIVVEKYCWAYPIGNDPPLPLKVHNLIFLCNLPCLNCWIIRSVSANPQDPTVQLR
ncbi:LEAF RUST 10 DISEASE-RESISTANCE LOCUS RECEPTOR-LIKE PROTEIN KINASE-like 2.7 [Eucalyptus grandis]|uniref:LEAF RUST 10 DISEASE-RESISTANCE LOCUS RECEPTOR-LIKE PROTEIN KINASE-like 2.7 n=1 Tax=Eucalyptus grandis TaxID=71139 RepID=UPI00192EFA93|nr:LEAF RUST 10 DISEASE-RESISTANCE LOCUS RECEPTOR-LIKE PROTEIN KINASE-like 2.7 [Eucalyptus grandis]